MTTDPKSAANELATLMNTKGYSLDFSMKSLSEEIDKIINSPEYLGQPEKELEENEALLSAYIGETLVQNLNGEWLGEFSVKEPFNNFYRSSVKIKGKGFNPTAILSYKRNGSKGTFRKELRSFLKEIDEQDKLPPI